MTPPIADVAARALEVSTPQATELPDPPRAVDGRIDLDALAATLRPGGFTLLESRGPRRDEHRWSYLVPAADARLCDDGSRTWLDTPHGRLDLGDDPFAAIDAVCATAGLTPEARDPSLPPLSGGLVGHLGYELAHRIEALPAVRTGDRTVPAVALDLAEHVVAVDHDSEQAVLVTRPLLARGDAHARAARLSEQLCVPQHRDLPPPPPAAQRVATSLPRARYLAAVEAVLAHIAAGEVFQVNLSQRLTARFEHDVVDLYHALCSQSDAPMAALLRAQDGSGIASVSPETFLVADGRHVVTRPIKGTRPRDDDPATDRALGAALGASAKDHAENVMVVDMQRNDLGRVCVPGSVHVPQLLALEAHPTVWHLVSSVAGTLHPRAGWGQLLAATFPCGSVTGTPKVAAMHLIHRYEPVRRDVYCGAIGYLSAGAVGLSVAIRTATRHADGRVDYGAGGGVVADSDPEAEHTESLDKAAAFLRAVCGHHPAGALR